MYIYTEERRRFFLGPSWLVLNNCLTIDRALQLRLSHAGQLFGQPLFRKQRTPIL